MALLMRLSAGKLTPQLMNCERNGLIVMSRTVTLKPYAVKPIDTTNYDEFNMKLGRPQSPHLTIYAPQLTSMLSITHRMTGAGLATITTGLGIAALVAPQSLTHYVEALGSLDIPSPLFLTAKAILVYPFTFHFFNGIRHLCWDYGLFLKLNQVYTTGYIMLLCSAFAAVGLLALS